MPEVGLIGTINNANQILSGTLDNTVVIINGTAIIPKGAWSSGTDYKGDLTEIDVVTVDGSSYACIENHTSSNENQPPNAEYWNLWAQKGNDIEAQSWAVGGTGTRTGEDTDNAKYYCEHSMPDVKSASGGSLHLTDSLNGKMQLTEWTKNLLQVTLADLKTRNTSGTWTDTSSSVSTYVKNGITFTVTHESGNVRSIVANGTSTAETDLYISRSFGFTELGTYMISGCNGSGVNYFIRVIGNGHCNSAVVGQDGAELIPTDTNNGIEIICRVVNGRTVSNATFQLQIEVGTVSHPYVPYEGMTITSANADSSVTSSVTVTNSTQAPLYLDSYDNETNVTNSYGANMSVNYATSICGQITLKTAYDVTQLQSTVTALGTI